MTGERPFATWMYRVALNVAISIARSQRWQEPALAPLDDETAALPADPAGAEREQRRGRAARVHRGTPTSSIAR